MEISVVSVASVCVFSVYLWICLSILYHVVDAGVFAEAILTENYRRQYLMRLIWILEYC